VTRDDFEKLPADERTVWLAAFAASYVAAINSPSHADRREARPGAVADAHMAVDAYREVW
jgi:hypothetical protein